jgi:LacI family repressor for deo operon, udp, cdd, tsx, nupC, and nupG
VSRILNGRETGVPIREETRQKVISVAAELGYRPNMMARALRGSRTSLIGVLAQNVTSLFHSQILRGFNDIAVKHSYRVFLGHMQRQMDIAVDYSSMFEQSHADGILIVGQLHGSEELLKILMQQHRFVVGVSDRIKRRSFPGVYGDSAIGTRLALDHLWEAGHRRIVCVTDPLLQDGQLRGELYRQYMHERGASEQSQVFETFRSFQKSYELGQQLFADFTAPDRPTAIFAATDSIAIGLLQAVFQAHLSVPQDISIVGYDDLDITPFSIPPLTTVRQSGFEMGQRAAEMLLNMIEGDQDSATVEDAILTPTLVVRQSTARVDVD